MTVAFKDSFNRRNAVVAIDTVSDPGPMVIHHSGVGVSRGLMQIVPATFRGYANGGAIPGGQAQLSRGEYVLSQRGLEKIGEEAIKNMRAAGVTITSYFKDELSTFKEAFDDLSQSVKSVIPEPEHIPDQPKALPTRRFNHGPASNTRGWHTPYRSGKAGHRTR